MALVALHGRDHCPGGPDPIPCLGNALPYAHIIWNEGGTVAVNQPRNLTPSAGTNNDIVEFGGWAEGYHSNPELFHADLDNGRINLYPEGGSDPRTPGVYVAHLSVSWAENWDNGDLYAMVNWAAGTSMDLQSWQTQMAYAKTQGASNRLTFDENVICTSVVTVVANSSGESTNSWVTGGLMHKGGGGGSRSLGQVTLTVVRLSEYPAANGAFVEP